MDRIRFRKIQLPGDELSNQPKRCSANAHLYARPQKPNNLRLSPRLGNFYEKIGVKTLGLLFAIAC